MICNRVCKLVHYRAHSLGLGTVPVPRAMNVSIMIQAAGTLVSCVLTTMLSSFTKRMDFIFDQLLHKRLG